MLLRGGQIKQMPGHPLPDPNALTAVCCKVSYSLRFSSSATAHATRASRRAAAVSARELIRNRLDGATAWTPTLAGPPTSTAIPSTSPGRAYRTVTCRPSSDVMYTRIRPCTTSAALGADPAR